MKHFEGRVIKAVSSKFYVDVKDGVKVCFARGRLKPTQDILVGDYVTVASDGKSNVIEDVKPRKNSLIRPYVSNIDACFIVIAPVPEPDFTLVDKIIVNCHLQQIMPVLVKNKCDVAKIYCSEYDRAVSQIDCSALTGQGIDQLLQIAKGKTVCFAGQSAVGKSSLINALFGSDVMQVGELTQRIQRGKNTTRRAEIIDIAGCSFIDTCGFSMLDAVDIPPEELRLYYDDFEEYRPLCRFNGCMHIDEPDCAVKARVGAEIGKGRYSRYVEIFKALKERNDTKYD